ncbi:MAG: hypothetical protein IJM73_03600 [Spirochaetales bacterium]|nr:hypothetical protein [Spirochaetales bacterium]
MFRKVLASVLVLVFAALTVFASALNPSNGFNGATVYDASYKAVKDAASVADGALVKTAGKAVVLSDGNLTVEVAPSSLVQFVSLGSEPVIYVIDGKAGVESSEAFTVKTTVTEYKVQAGSSIYVITDSDNETAFLEKGSAQADNLITGRSTAVQTGKTIDNSQNGKLSDTTLAQYWAAPEKEETAATETAKAEPEKPAQQPEAQPETKPEAQPTAEEKVQAAAAQGKPLTKTFEYYGIKATVDAYIGMAVITYPEFVTDQEIAAAAAAAVRAYPEETKDIYFEIAGPGRAIVTYPETYGIVEFNYAMGLLEKELPGYLAYVLGAASAQETAKAEPEKPAEPEVKPEPQPEPAPQPEPTPEPQPEPAPEPTPEPQPEPAPEPAPEAPAAPAEETKPEKTPLATSTREEAKSAAEKQKKGFRFGLSGALIAFDGTGSEYKTVARLDDRVALLKRARAVIEPGFTFKGFEVGLRLNLEIILSGNGLSIVNPFTFNANGVTNIINSVMKYVSVLGYSNEELGLTVRADRKSETEFESPLFDGASRYYKNRETLSGNLSFNTGAFTLSAFFDDLDFNARLAGRSEFAGIRAGLKFGKMQFGFSTIADFKGALKATAVYPAVDLTLPFTLSDMDFVLKAGAAVKLDKDGYKGLLAEGSLSVTEKVLTFTAGAAYNRGTHFNDMINYGPVDVTAQAKGTFLDNILGAGLNTEHFGLNAHLIAPITLNHSFGSRLAYNTVKTKNGQSASLSADIFNLQADLKLGKFVLSAGTAINGFNGKIANVVRAIKKQEGRRAALLSFLDPETTTYYLQGDIADEHFGLYFRADLKGVNGKLCVPLSGGLKFSF